MHPSDLDSIKSRNARVEADKAWETSWTRRLSVAGATYLIAFLYMNFGLKVQPAALHAAVPTGGYLLSTLSLSGMKKLWIGRFYQPQKPEREE